MQSFSYCSTCSHFKLVVSRYRPVNTKVTLEKVTFGRARGIWLRFSLRRHSARSSRRLAVPIGIGTSLSPLLKLRTGTAGVQVPMLAKWLACSGPNKNSLTEVKEFLVGPEGLEPSASWSQTRRATNCAIARCSLAGLPFIRVRAECNAPSFSAVHRSPRRQASTSGCNSNLWYGEVREI